MSDVFVSYKKEDWQLTEPLVESLRTEGFHVWWDDGLTPRTAWDAMLEREIAAASAVVVLWTPRSVTSEWVRTEAHYGQDRGKLVPVMLEACTPPIAFMLRQTVNLTAWRGDRADREWRKLLTWIADLAATKPGNANIPQALGAAQPNRFRDAIGYLAPDDPIVDGGLVNASTPAATAFRDAEDGPVMRALPKGAFLLGSPDTDPDGTAVERPQRRVEIPAPFAIGVYLVLVSEYAAIMGGVPVIARLPNVRRHWWNALRASAEQPQAASRSSANAPVTQVSYDDAQSFANSLSDKTGHAYRLPSEAEWEYACRAGSHTRYTFGDTIGPAQARFGAAAGPVAAGTFPPNAFGLYDMHGNVREWTADLWHESYDATPLDGRPATSGHGSMQVVRGGGWCDSPAMLRSAARMRATRSIRSDAIGFRIVRDLA
jgi:formylglycine-generating enzyme required for sulfatase activity